MIPEQIIRNPEESTESYCWRLMIDYKAPAEELKFCYNYIDNEGERQFSKHITLMELWHHAPEEWIKGTKDTRNQFFNKIQHRSILPCEITFDIDDRNLGSWMTFPSIKDKAKFIQAQFRE